MEDLILFFVDKISYMVELIIASFIYTSACKKKGRYPLRFMLGSAALLICAFLVNCFVPIPKDGLAMFVYWGAFLVVIVPFVNFCIDAPMVEVLYCVLCASATQHLIYDIQNICAQLLQESFAVYVLYLTIYVSGYISMYCMVVPRLVSNGKFHASKADLPPMFAILILVWVLTLLERASAPTRESQIIYTCSDALCCVYLLWGQVHERQKLSLQRELDGIRHVWRQQQAQYWVTQESIDTINMKCHDLRHQIREMYNTANQEKKAQYFEEIDRAIMIYDTAVQTGNPALDTVLMEKGLFCKSHNIDWTCMADGARLSFMQPEDIYALLGNALENAIQAVMKLDKPKKRVINTRIFPQAELLVIQIQNYYVGELTFHDGLPLTTKGSGASHGYGMKSIRYTAEKYGGTVSVTAEDGVFTLQIMFTVPEC